MHPPNFKDHGNSIRFFFKRFPIPIATPICINVISTGVVRHLDDVFCTSQLLLLNLRGRALSVDLERRLSPSKVFALTEGRRQY